MQVLHHYINFSHFRSADHRADQTADHLSLRSRFSFTVTSVNQLLGYSIYKMTNGHPFDLPPASYPLQSFDLLNVDSDIPALPVFDMDSNMDITFANDDSSLFGDFDDTQFNQFAAPSQQMSIDTTTDDHFDLYPTTSDLSIPDDERTTDLTLQAPVSAATAAESQESSYHIPPVNFKSYAPLQKSPLQYELGSSSSSQDQPQPVTNLASKVSSSEPVQASTITATTITSAPNKPAINPIPIKTIKSPIQRPKSAPLVCGRHYIYSANWPPIKSTTCAHDCSFNQRNDVYPPADAPLHVWIQAYALRWATWASSIEDPARRAELLDKVTERMRESWDTAIKEDYYPRPKGMTIVNESNTTQAKRSRKRALSFSQLPAGFAFENNDKYGVTNGELATYNLSMDQIKDRAKKEDFVEGEKRMQEIMNNLPNKREEITIRDWSSCSVPSVIGRNLLMYCFYVVQESRKDVRKLTTLIQGFKRDQQIRITEKRISIHTERELQHMALATEIALQEPSNLDNEGELEDQENVADEDTVEEESMSEQEDIDYEQGEEITQDYAPLMKEVESDIVAVHAAREVINSPKPPPQVTASDGGSVDTIESPDLKEAYIAEHWVPRLRVYGPISKPVKSWNDIKDILSRAGHESANRNLALRQFREGFKQYCIQKNTASMPNSASPSQTSSSDIIDQDSPAEQWPSDPEVLASIPAEGIPGAILMQHFSNRIDKRQEDFKHQLFRIATVDSAFRIFPPKVTLKFPSMNSYNVVPPATSSPSQRMTGMYQYPQQGLQQYSSYHPRTEVASPTPFVTPYSQQNYASMFSTPSSNAFASNNGYFNHNNRGDQTMGQGIGQTHWGQQMSSGAHGGNLKRPASTTDGRKKRAKVSYIDDTDDSGDYDPNQ